jgi:hypothetical protein
MSTQRKTALTGKSGGFQIRQDNDTTEPFDPLKAWFALAANVKPRKVRNGKKWRANHGRH